MPEVILRGKTGVPQTKQEGNTIVVKKDIANAVLVERTPATRRTGKQAPGAVYTKAEVESKVAAATKLTAATMSTLANQLGANLEKKFAAEIMKVQEKSATDTRKAIALNENLLKQTEKHDKDLTRIRKERNDFKRRALDVESSNSSVEPRAPRVIPKTPKVKLEAPGTPAASSRAPGTPAKRDKSMAR